MDTSRKVRLSKVERGQVGREQGGEDTGAA